MFRPKSALTFVAAGLAAGAVCAVALAQGPQAQSITPSPAFAGQDLTTFPTTGWLTNGGDVYNRRYSPLTQINRDNVAQLKAAWRTQLGGSGVGVKYSGEAQPIVHEGVIYVITGADDVFALSVDSGETLWSYKANLNDKISTVCCGWTSRGVGLGDGKVYVGQLDGKLLALDQRTGAVVWTNPGGAMGRRVHDHERAALLRRARRHGFAGAP